jgi:hypothetical protein
VIFSDNMKNFNIKNVKEYCQEIFVKWMENALETLIGSFSVAGLVKFLS